MKEKQKCINCEVEFEVTTDNEIEPIFCPFCGDVLFNTDSIDEDDSELEELLFEDVEL